jgi:uncharacterized RDD family membrane protein YckC
LAPEIYIPPGLTTDGLLGRRYLARLIDSFAIIILIAILVLAYSVVVTGGPHPVAKFVVLPALFLVWIGYGAVLESSKWQATVGKRLMGLRVYNAQGSRLRLTQAAGRNLLKDGPLLVFGMIPGGQLPVLGLLVVHVVVMHCSPAYQAIHDRAAHSWVAAPEETTQLHIG